MSHPKVFASALVVNIAVGEFFTSSIHELEKDLTFLDLYAGLGKHAGLSRHPILFAKVGRIWLFETVLCSSF